MDHVLRSGKFKNKISMKQITCIVFSLVISLYVHAQKPLIQDYEEVISKAKAELDSSLQSGVMKEFAEKNKITGEYSMDITIHERGKVLTVFVNTNNGNDLKMQTRLKDFVGTLEFNFKMPKGKMYKFQYTFHFS
jgi:hypothetical protein